MKIIKEIGNEIKGIIFDFDGTLIDSEQNYFLGDRKLLAKYGVDLTLEMKNNYIGIGEYNFVNDMKKKFNLKKSIDELLIEKKNLYKEFALKNIRLFPNMINLVKLFHKNNYPIAIASGSDKDVLLELLEISEIKKYFSIVLSSSEVENGKPEPDVFLEAAKNLDILPENILVFEDSKYGVTASKKAGMACIAVPEKNHELPREFYDANILFNNGIEELQPENILNLINKTKETLKK